MKKLGVTAAAAVSLAMSQAGSAGDLVSNNYHAVMYNITCVPELGILQITPVNILIDKPSGITLPDEGHSELYYGKVVPNTMNDRVIDYTCKLNDKDTLKLSLAIDAFPSHGIYIPMTERYTLTYNDKPIIASFKVDTANADMGLQKLSVQVHNGTLDMAFVGAVRLEGWHTFRRKYVRLSLKKSSAKRFTDSTDKEHRFTQDMPITNNNFTLEPNK